MKTPLESWSQQLSNDSISDQWAITQSIDEVECVNLFDASASSRKGNGMKSNTFGFLGGGTVEYKDVQLEVKSPIARLFEVGSIDLSSWWTKNL